MEDVVAGEYLAACERAATSLDKSRQLVGKKRFEELRSGWRVSIYPEALEATITFVPRNGPRGGSRALDLRDEELATNEQMVVDPETGEILREADDSWVRTNSQAATTSRRYFVANRLRYMWVVTHDPKRICESDRFDRRRTRREMARFARRIRLHLGERFPYWYSPELHPGGNGWHVNLFVPMRVAHQEVADLWGVGFVWVTDFQVSPRAPHGEPLGLCRTPQDGWRRAARYGCKYSQKDWSREHVGRRAHRYEIGQGFTPTPIRRWANSKREAQEIIRAALPVGAADSLEVWDSSDAEDWNRPPVMVFRW